ncbi:hypothetical protein Pd630_LPD17017 (plasmid) [Rhodococcus opacus PD630]|nr:hypothetical protein Pd630_LPD17017 [Rhodococcus opacus PD630]
MAMAGGSPVSGRHRQSVIYRPAGYRLMRRHLPAPPPRRPFT